MSDQELGQLRDSLLSDPRPAGPARNGREAMQQHKLLAAAVHRASRLHRRKQDNETEAWVRYVTDFFPAGHNDEADARLLFDGWRTSLLKDDRPVVPITHGQSEAHWVREDGRPCLNLEDAQADYEYSVERFIEHLQANPERRRIALDRMRESSWEVRNLSALASATTVAGSFTIIPAPAVSASVADNTSVIKLDDESPH